LADNQEFKMMIYDTPGGLDDDDFRRMELYQGTQVGCP
jgi:hypothetical protein